MKKQKNIPIWLTQVFTFIRIMLRVGHSHTKTSLWIVEIEKIIVSSSIEYSLHWTIGHWSYWCWSKSSKLPSIIEITCIIKIIYDDSWSTVLISCIQSITQRNICIQPHSQIQSIHKYSSNIRHIRHILLFFKNHRSQYHRRIWWQRKITSLVSQRSR